MFDYLEKRSPGYKGFGDLGLHHSASLKGISVYGYPLESYS
jgi:hypothetical protein